MLKEEEFLVSSIELTSYMGTIESFEDLDSWRKAKEYFRNIKKQIPKSLPTGRQANKSQISISNIQTVKMGDTKKYDLEERTFQFAKDIRLFIKRLPKTVANTEDSRQLVKASGSIGANYIEANEKLSKKDFRLRLKISRKESKESVFWLRLLIECNNLENDDEAKRLLTEAVELKKILSAIIEKTK